MSSSRLSRRLSVRHWFAGRRCRCLAALLGIAVLAAACTSDSGSADDEAGAGSASPSSGDELAIADLEELPEGESIDYGPAPDAPDLPVDPEVADALDQLLVTIGEGVVGDTVQIIVASEDPRYAWVLTDFLRFLRPSGIATQMIEGVETLTGADLDPERPWGSATNHLIAWDTPPPPEYFEFKADLFALVDPRWAPLFDAEAEIDWRHVSWGGVGIDDRPLGTPDPCSTGCIPALDDPAVTAAAGGDWYPDDAVVFGVEVNGESRAYPKNIMEVHEMVNDTIGGRRIAMPYCTLCGSAQVYLTDTLGPEFEQPVMRTSGLLRRSNKMMYDLSSMSFVDTFLGTATSGPLAAAGVEFEQVSVVTSTWADWKASHPDTTIIAEDGGLGREYSLDPLDGRDDDGPIFPIGEADTRLPVHEPVLGVTTESGMPVAFHVASARQILESGAEVQVENISLVLDGSGVRAVLPDGSDAGGHQAFWFAWSQFEPETALWPADFG